MEFVKLFLLVFAAYLIINVIIGYRRLMKQQKKEFERIVAEKEKYHSIDADVFDCIPDEELKMAINYHIWNKEDEDFENLYSNLTDGEKTIHTIFLVETAIENGRGTLANFYIDANELYFPLLIDSYQKLGCEKVVTVLEKLNEYHDAEIKGEDLIDLDVEETADDLEPLPSYDLFTLDYMDAIKEDNLAQKIIDYIKENKEEFIN